MTCNIRAKIIGRHGKVHTAECIISRPRWEDVHTGYPKNLPASSVLGLVGHNSQTNVEQSASAIRLSIALLRAGMKKALDDTGKIFGPNLHNMVLTSGNLHGSRYFTDVKKLKDWLSKSEIWGKADEEINVQNSNDLMKVRGRLKRKNGIYIILNASGQGHATLWVGALNNVIEGNNYIDRGGTVYFWRLKGFFENLEKDLGQIKDFDDWDSAVMAAAKAMLPRANDEIEYGATICERNGKFFISKETTRQGTSDAVMIMDCVHGTVLEARCTANCGGTPRAYIHTHGNSAGKVDLSAGDLYASFRRQRPIYLANNQGDLIGRAPKIIGDFEDPDNERGERPEILPEQRSEYIENLHHNMSNGDVASEFLLGAYLEDNSVLIIKENIQ